MGLGREVGFGSMEAADALWEGQTLLKSGPLGCSRTHRNTDTHTHTHKSENSISASFTPFTWRI